MHRICFIYQIVFHFYDFPGILVLTYMPARDLSRPLRGIIPPMVTPLDDPTSIDRPGLERLIEHLISGGVHGIFILGTTGEGTGISYRLRHELIDRTCGQVAGRVPVLVGITDTSYEESCSLAAYAKTVGANAVVSAPPSYFAMSQNDLFRLIQMLSTSIELPLYLYNMPSLTKTRFEPQTVLRTSELPNIYGLKDSSGDLRYLRTIARQMGDRPDFSLLVGPEELLFDSLIVGAHGGVCGGANLFPKLFVALYEAARAGDHKNAIDLQTRVRELGELLYGIGEAESSYLRGLKLGLELIGICSSTLALPYMSADLRRHGMLGEILKEYV
jgi:2-dehydro-3-deoxy-D-pentonate aldolase